MKHTLSHSLLCWCVFFTGLAQVFSQNQFGLRLFYQNDLIQTPDHWAQGPAAGEWELGAFVRHQFARSAAVRLEANFVRARYKLSDDRFYALKFCGIPEWQISRIFSIGAGGFVNVLLFDPYDLQKKIETGVLVNMGMRYRRVEVQGRFQRSFVRDRKMGLGAGLAYYFGAKKEPGATSK